MPDRPPPETALQWLHRPPSPTAVGRVFCIPHAGSGSNIFGRWPEERDGVELLRVELPGRLARFDEPMPATFPELAAALVEGLAPSLDVPYAFFGHCWSALLAYEATVQAEAAARPAPTRLFVSSQVAPQDGPVGRMLTMDDAELAADLAATVRAHGHHPDPELIALYAAIMRVDIEVSRRYVVPDPTPVSCPVTAIGWTNDDSEVRPERMGGWSACGDTTFVVLPGHHERFIDAPADLLATLHDGLGVRTPA